MMYLSIGFPQLAAYYNIFSASVRYTSASLALSMLMLSFALVLSSITLDKNSSA